MVTKRSRLMFLIKNKTFIKAILFRLNKRKSLTLQKSNKQNFLAKYIFNYRYNCKKPRSFNEYLGWLKYNYKNEDWYLCADKIGMKTFLVQNGLGDLVVKTLGIYKKSDEIDLSKLPNKFVLKTNHDCGSVFICDKTESDFSLIFKKLDEALAKQYSNYNDEWVYDKITPLIFAEELLEPTEGEKLRDYKVFSFNSCVGFVFVAQDRDADCRFSVFDSSFNILPTHYIYLRPKKEELPKRPECWETICKVASQIGSKLKFARVDFYITKQGLKIGEITFFSQTGLGPFTNKKIDFYYGKLFAENCSEMLEGN